MKAGACLVQDNQKKQRDSNRHLFVCRIAKAMITGGPINIFQQCRCHHAARISTGDMTRI
jgi:hypothetical protein